MKRIALCVVLGACGGGDKAPEKKAPEVPQAASQVAGDVKKVADKANELAAGVNKPALTADEYEKLVLGLESCQVKGYSIDDKCPGLEAMREKMKNTSTAWKDLGGMNASIGRKHIGHASPAIRVKSTELMGSMLGTSEGSQDALLAQGDKETDPGVLQAIIRVVANSGGKNPKVAAFLLKTADHENVEVRLQSVYAISSGWNREMAGGAKKLGVMAEKDASPKVKQAACEYAGGLGNKELMPMYTKTTGNKKDKDMYSACMRGLLAMFHSYPLYETSNDAAYKLFLKRLNEKPRTEDAPPWIIGSSFRYFGDDAKSPKLVEWKAKAKYFKVADVKKALMGIIADKKSNWMFRTGALESLSGLGTTKGEFEKLKKGYDAKVPNDELVLKKIDEAIAKAP